MILLILLGIIAYVAGDEYFNMFKVVIALGVVYLLLQRFFANAPYRRERRRVRKQNKQIDRAQRELNAAMREVSGMRKAVDSALSKCLAIEQSKSGEVAEPVRVVQSSAPRVEEQFDPYDINFQELSIEQLNKRLNALYTRMDKYRYVNGATPEAWEKFKKTKTYRSLSWDIKETQERLERKVRYEKERWAKV